MNVVSIVQQTKISFDFFLLWLHLKTCATISLLVNLLCVFSDVDVRVVHQCH